MKDSRGQAASSGVEGLIEEGEAFSRLSGEHRRKRPVIVIVIGSGRAGLRVTHHLKKLRLEPALSPSLWVSELRRIFRNR